MDCCKEETQCESGACTEYRTGRLDRDFSLCLILHHRGKAERIGIIGRAIEIKSSQIHVFRVKTDRVKGYEGAYSRIVEPCSME
jgi:hypothetical protein